MEVDAVCPVLAKLLLDVQLRHVCSEAAVSDMLFCDAV